MQLQVFTAFCGNRAGDVFEGVFKTALNFSLQALLNFDEHKLLYFPAHLI